MNVVLVKLKLAGLNTAFQERLATYQTPWEKAVTFVPSGKEVEDYSWLGDVAQMEEWKDELVPRGLAEFDYSIKNKRFAAPPLKIFVDDLNDDQYGQLQVRIQDQAEKAKAFPGVLVRNLRMNGETTLCYDGQNFHSTTHQEGESGVQSNLYTGTGLSSAQIEADFEGAWKLMNGYKTDKGDPWVRENPDLVIVAGPAAYLALRKKFLNPTTDGGGKNPYYGLVSDVELDMGMTGNSWYLEDRAPRLKAYVVQEREPVTPRHTDVTSDSYVLGDYLLYTAKWRGNAGYGQWRHSVKIKNS